MRTAAALAAASLSLVLCAAAKRPHIVMIVA